MIRPLDTAEVQFQLGTEIGAEGRNSQVFEAHDVQLDATIAVKKIEKVRFADVAEYFVEASLVYRCAHTNIVPIHYACQDADCIYLAMPLYQNGSLKTLMSQRHLTNREIVTFATQFLAGLHNIHSKGMIHFDIKPDNILLSDRGEALISDFGLTREVSYRGTAGQDRIYGKMVPPEAFATDDFSRAFDIYQVGLTLHRMCVGDAAFYADFDQYKSAGTLDRNRFQFAVLNGRFPERSSYLEHTPAPLINTIKSCLERDSSNRTTAALEVVNDMAGIDGALLDWSYEEQGGLRLWEKKVGDMTIKLEVDADSRSTATKTRDGSPARRVVDYCKERLTRQEIKRFLRNH